jgi:hypothetical protein
VDLVCPKSSSEYPLSSAITADNNYQKLQPYAYGGLIVIVNRSPYSSQLRGEGAVQTII